MPKRSRSSDTGSTPKSPCAESQRLAQDRARTHNWKRWGPYLSERQWGTVREDYSPYGTCWDYFPHDHARSRAYRWGEDGLLGITDRQARLCFALAVWNGKDAILKERLYGLNGHEGNHGEDVKELYYYLASTPTHSYLKGLYKYPHAAYPYDDLLNENQRRGVHDPEYDLLNTGLFDDQRYFDITCEYAKASPDDLLIRVTVTNHGPDAHDLHLLPTLWFRNTWTWGCRHEGCSTRPALQRTENSQFVAQHPTLGAFEFHWETQPDAVLLTHNETNSAELFDSPNLSPLVKDAFHTHLIDGGAPEVLTAPSGTKGAPLYRRTLAAGASETFQFRLRMREPKAPKPFSPFGKGFETVFAQRQSEHQTFYQDTIGLKKLDTEAATIAEQGYAGLLWTKQFYHYVVEHWLEGDPATPPPPEDRLRGRNRQWQHVYARDILSMPDKWEYPWFAAWDTAFHMIPFARIDPDFSKDQLLLMLREWYLHPNGQLPAYEFAFDDVNPPVHAWAVWRLYKITAKDGVRDRDFLESAFQKLLLNFTWWVNRKDENGNNLFGGGFLGLDNIGPFDRSKPFPGGGTLTQADGTAWMAFYCLTMLSMALELARGEDRIYGAYGDMASKFFEHFVQICEAFNHLNGTGLWDERDGFYYDQVSQNGRTIPVKTRSLVGLLPLIAVEVLDLDLIESLPGFSKRFHWFVENQPALAAHLVRHPDPESNKLLLMLSTEDRLRTTLNYLTDEQEFLSDYGIRSLSKHHEQHPSKIQLGGETLTVGYSPGESTTGLFGGNSNWRGPIWFPVNYLLIESLERYHHFFGSDLTLEHPKGSGQNQDCASVAADIQRRLTTIFRFDSTGQRPCHGDAHWYRKDGPWKDLILFHEYFHGDNALGLGASHQTGWTALVVRLLEEQVGEKPA